MAFSRSSLYSILIIVALYGATFFFRFLIDLKPIENRFTLVPPPPGMKYFVFGFNEPMADSLWLRYVQDIDRCELQGYIGEKQKKCAKGWSYQMLDTITELAPRFRMPYALGPLMLSVVGTDIEGAKLIFDKGVRAFPTDWRILYRAAYFYLSEMKQNDHAAALLLRAYQSGGPDWLPLLAARLYSTEGQLALGIATLRSYLEQVQSPELRERIEKRLVYLNCRLEAESAKSSGRPEPFCDSSIE